jgi:hypothetical protein
MRLEDLFAWTPGEARAAVASMVPEGWSFRCVSEEGQWVAEVRDDQVAVVFESAYPEESIVLFNVFGFLLRRSEPESARHPLWARGDRQDARGPRRPGALGLPTQGPGPDPEDLDPEAVALVYSRRP